MKLSWKSGVALIIGGILLGGSLSAVAQNDGSTPDGPKDAEVKAAHFRGRGPGGPGGPGHHLGKLVHSESIVEGEEDGTFNTIRVDAGTLQAVDGNTLSIERADGESVRVTVDDDTEIRRDREEVEVGDLEQGDHVIAHQVKEGDGDFVTKHVMAISAERYAEFEANREACTDDDEATECERPGHRGRGGPRMRGEAGENDEAPEPALFEEAAI